MPERAGFLDVIVPVELFPGETTVLGQINLPFALSNLTLSGRVERLDGGATEGLLVQVRRAAEGTGACSAEAPLETITDASGAFTVRGLRPGLYRASATGDGLTVGVSAAIELERDEDASGQAPATAQTPADLVITVDDAGDAITLVGTEAGLPDGLVRLAEVDVELNLPFDWSDDMRISSNPTFASGSTGWVSAQSGRRYTFDADPGNVRLYVQLRSSCAESGLFTGSVGYDPDGPEVARVRLGTVELENAADEIVVVDSAASVPLAIDVGDATGVVATVTLTADDPSVAPTTQTFTVLGSGLVVLREQVDVPLAQGRYTATLTLADPLGNLAVPDLVVYDVIRDLDPPTTPLPATDALEVTSDVAYVWLKRRSCFRSDDPDDRYEALVCEENPREFGFFEVRGGPALPDFTPFNQPPFTVPLNVSGETEIEIRAVDLANNASESIGRVTITDRRDRELMSLPVGRRLKRGPGGDHQLSSEGGTALLLVEHDPVVPAETTYSYLLAQPSDVAAVGFQRETSPLPEGMRKLSCGTDCFNSTDECSLPYQRQAGALGSGDGALTWTEFGPRGFDELERGLQVWPNNAGRYDLTDALGYTTSLLSCTDLDGELASDRELCASRGRQRCHVTTSFLSGFQPPVERTLVRDGRLVTLGAGDRALALADDDDAPDTEVVQGPAFIAAMVSPYEAVGFFKGLVAAVEVVEGTGLALGYYEQLQPGAPWLEQAAGAEQQGLLASGSGLEQLRSDYLAFFDPNARYLAGVIIEEGVTIEVAVRPRAVDGGQPMGGTDLIETLGMVVLPAPADGDPIDDANVAGVLQADKVPAWTLHLSNRDPLSLDVLNGITELRYGDQEPADPSVLRSELAQAPEGISQHTWKLEAASVASFSTVSEGSGAVQAPSQCSLLLSLDREVFLRDVRLRGAGALDHLNWSLLRADLDTTLGRYTLDDDAFVSDLYLDGIPFEPADPALTTCDDANLGVLASDAASGTFTGTLVDNELVTGTLANTNPVLEDNAPQSTMLQMLTVDGLPGESYKVVMRFPEGTSAGDADLHVRFGAEPTFSDYDCRPYANGSNETCYLVMPPGETQMFVGVAGFAVSNPFRVHIEKLEVVLTRPMLAGDSFFTLFTGVPSGVAEGLTRFGGPPAYEGVDCSFDDAFPNCFETADSDGDLYISLATAPGAVDYTFSLQRTRSEFLELGPYTLEGGQALRVDGTGDGVREIRYDFDAPAGAGGRLCSYGGECVIVPDQAGQAVHLTVFADGDGGDYAVSVQTVQTGCDEVKPFLAADAKLAPGRYLMTVGAGFGDNRLSWPDAAPQVTVGVPNATVGPFEVVGVPTVTSAPAADAVVVNAYQEGLPTCDVSLTFATAAELTALDVDDTRLVAAARRTDDQGMTSDRLVGSAGLRAGDLVPLAPEEPSDVRIMGIGIHEDSLVVVRAGPNGQPPITLDRHPLTPWPTPDAITTERLITVADVGSTQRVTHAVVEDGLATLFFVGEGQPRLRSYRLPTEAEPELQPALVRSLPVAPDAVSVDELDVFLWRDGPVFGGSLHHTDLRQVAPLFPGAAASAVAVTSLEGAALIATVVAETPLRAEHVALAYDDDGQLQAATLAAQGLTTHVAGLSGTRAAILDKEDGSYHLALTSITLSLPTTEELMMGAADKLSATQMRVAVASADALLAGAPPSPPGNPLSLAQQVMLEADGETVVLIGYGEQGRELAIYDASSGPSSWAAMAPVATFSLDGSPAGLSVGGSAVVVRYLDGRSGVFADDGGGWVAYDAGALVQRRVLAAHDGEVLVVEQPGDIFGSRPPAWMRASWRAPHELEGGGPGSGDGGIVDAPASDYRLAAETYLHEFPRISVGEAGAIYLYDTSASPPVLWRAMRHGEPAIPIDGPHRPLTSGQEAVGTDAAPQEGLGGLLWIKRDEVGNSVMRMTLP